jgi:hypothetical protein
MVDTYGTGSSHEDFGAGPQSYGAEASRRPTYPSRDLGTRAGARWNLHDDLRQRRRADLFFEDSIVMLGILLGGAIGYIAASTLRKPEWNSRQTQKSSERGGVSRFFSRQSGTHTSTSLDKDETTDLIASNKVEGTAVYNRQGEKLGEVYNFMVGKRSGEVAYAIMSFGGFLGVGQKYHPLPWNALTYDTDKKGYVIDANKERLMRAPSYQAGEEPFSRPEYGQQVRDYWSSGLT